MQIAGSRSPLQCALRRNLLGLGASALASVLALGTARAQVPADADWRQDAPGVVHRITLPLPAPYSTHSDSNGPRVVSRPAGAMPKVPPGFAVEQWASGLDQPRVVRRAPNGDIFLAESGAGVIRVYRANAAESTARPESTVFAGGLTLPFGIAFWPPADPHYVYIGETGSVVRFPYQSGDVKARGPAETVIPELPTGGHWTRDLAASPDGSTLYLSIGSESNAGTSVSGNAPGGIQSWEARHGLGAFWGDEEGRAVVLALDPRTGATRPFANGLRNCSGLAIQPGTGAPWCATNERDGLGDNLPPDYATHVTDGGFYGWPWYYIGDHEDPRLKGKRPDLAGRVTVPDVLIAPHSAPLGITFYDGASFPAEYRGDAFVALHGSWNRSRRTGYKVIRLRFDNGRPTGSYEDFLTGFVASDSGVWGRPVDVAVAADGSLLVTEDGNGTIWRVSYRH